MTDLSADVAALADKSLLVLDDDAPLRTRLGRALEQRGFEPTLVSSVQEALTAVKSHAPAFAVLDMRLEDGSGLKVVEAVRSSWASLRVVTASPARALLMFGTNLGSLLITAIALAFMCHGLHHPIGYGSAVFVVGAAALFSAIIPVPGNVGVGEAALAAGLVAVGVPSGPAFAIAVTQRIATSYLPPVYGAWALRWLRREDYIS